MTTYNVSIPDSKNAFFLEFLELIGAEYNKEDEIDFQLTEEQQQILVEQDNIAIDQCTDANSFFQEMKNKYDL